MDRQIKEAEMVKKVLGESRPWEMVVGLLAFATLLYGPGLALLLLAHGPTIWSSIIPK